MTELAASRRGKNDFPAPPSGNHLTTDSTSDKPSPFDISQHNAAKTLGFHTLNWSDIVHTRSHYEDIYTAVGSYSCIHHNVAIRFGIGAAEDRRRFDITFPQVFRKFR